MATEEGLSPALSHCRGLYLEQPVNLYTSAVVKRARVMDCLKKGCGATSCHPSRTLLPGTSIFWGFEPDVEPKIFQSWQERRPFLHVDHAYFKRGYRNPVEESRFRINFCHFHQTRVFTDLPDDRANGWRRQLQPWKKDGRVIVVIVPSPKITNAIGVLRGRHVSPEDWARSVHDRLKRITDRPVLIKIKGEGLAGVLVNAFAVVSISSVAEVEAVAYGVPVFVSQDSPAAQVGRSLDDLDGIESPIYPDRENWLRTLSYSQFTAEEMKNGVAFGILRELYGNH